MAFQNNEENIITEELSLLCPIKLVRCWSHASQVIIHKSKHKKLWLAPPRTLTRRRKRRKIEIIAKRFALHADAMNDTQICHVPQMNL